MSLSGGFRLPATVLAFLTIATPPALAGSPANDDCQKAGKIGLLTYTTTVSGIDQASSSSGDPAPSCASTGNRHSVWYEYTAPADGAVSLSTAGSTYDSVAWVGTGSCGTLTEIACDDDSAGSLNARVAFPVSAGRTYRVMLGSSQALQSGTLQLLVESLVVPPQIDADQTWTLADSPILITADTTILPGVTVTVEPGVVVNLQQGARLFVQGSLLGAGTVSQPISFIGGGVSFVYLEVYGSLVLSNAVMDVQVRPASQGTLLFTDTTFDPNGTVFNLGTGYFLSLDRCVFNGSSFWTGGGTILLRDTSFLNNFVQIGGSVLRLRNVSSTGSTIYGVSLHDFEQPVNIDNLSVTNAAGPGVDLIAGNFFFGSNVQLTGNTYPVQLGGAGILPGSTLPSTGNLNDLIKVEFASNGAWSMVWADPGIPYAMTGGQYHAGTLKILPGVTVRMEPNFTFWDDNSVVDARGLPGSPVRFEQLVPGQTWQGLQYFHRFENCVIDGGQVGARFHSSTFEGHIDNCIIQNNDFGMQNDALVRKTQFLNNTVGAWGNDWSLGLESQTNPNSFVNNLTAVEETSGHFADARYNWWNDPSGPASPDNPGGGGEVVSGCCVQTVPFLTAPPDFTDDPPIVRLLASPRREDAGGDYSSFVDPGTPVIISWESTDDVAVVAHRVEFYHSLNFTWTVIANLPGWQRSYEWIVPDVGFIGNSTVPRLRVVAIDSAGQEGWDEHKYLIPTGTETGTLTLNPDPTGPFEVGDAIGQVCVNAVGTSSSRIVFELSFDGDQRHIPLGSRFSSGCLPLPLSAPFVSTDTARIRMHTSGGQNRVKYFFGNTFSIRPDAMLGDSPPTVTLISPAGGASFPGAGIVPIAWTASDDEGVRSVDIQVSTDGGRTWHFIAEELPGTATSFNWQLPPSAGIADVRVRVMASDVEFQTSSDGADTVFTITPGSGGCTGPPAEVTGVTVDPITGTMHWLPTGAGHLYDVARGLASDLHVGVPAACISQGSPDTFYDDPTLPPPGEANYYIIRAVSACGTGPWGWASSGQSRSACP